MHQQLNIQQLYVLPTLYLCVLYMVMSREQTAGLSRTMKVDNTSIERVEEFIYLGTTLTNQNSIRKEIKSRLK